MLHSEDSGFNRLKRLFVRKVDFWFSFLTCQKRGLWDGGWPVLRSQSAIICCPVWMPGGQCLAQEHFSRAQVVSWHLSGVSESWTELSSCRLLTLLTPRLRDPSFLSTSPHVCTTPLFISRQFSLFLSLLCTFYIKIDTILYWMRLDTRHWEHKIFRKHLTGVINQMRC